MQDLKRIGVLTSGGDSPGMNAAVRPSREDRAVSGDGGLRDSKRI